MPRKRANESERWPMRYRMGIWMRMTSAATSRECKFETNQYCLLYLYSMSFLNSFPTCLTLIHCLVFLLLPSLSLLFLSFVTTSVDLLLLQSYYYYYRRSWGFLNREGTNSGNRRFPQLQLTCFPCFLFSFLASLRGGSSRLLSLSLKVVCNRHT